MGRLQLLIGISVFWVPLSMLFNGFNVIVLPTWLGPFTGSAQKATVYGLLTFVGLTVGMLVQVVAGIASDHLRPRWGRIGMICVGTLFLLVTLALFSFSRTLLAVAAAFIMIEVFANVAQAAEQGFIPDLIPLSHRGTASGFKDFTELGGSVLGFALLGTLLGGELTPTLFTIGGALLLSLLIVLLLVREHAGAGGTDDQRELIVLSSRSELKIRRSFILVVLSRFLFLLGVYAVGRFFLFFIAYRLALDSQKAAGETGSILTILTLITAVVALPAGWASDRLGRRALMLVGSVISALGVLLLTAANSTLQILLFGALMAVGSGAFASANWALTADLAPSGEGARYLGLANLGTAGAAASAGLFGPLVDWGNGIAAGMGYSALFIGSGAFFLASAIVLQPTIMSVSKPHAQGARANVPPLQISWETK